VTEGPIRLPRAIADAILAQAHAESPLEACGLIPGAAFAADGGEPLRYVPCRNALASPVRYTIHPEDLLRVAIDADDAGGVIWGIAHSHVRSPAVPSPTDVDLAYYPDAVYLVVSLSDAPALRAWRIADGSAREVELELA
jgi:[CysO sulfur-carrier protein]-S-L-cysteine hydrolase